MKRGFRIALVAAQDQARNWGTLAGTGIFLLFILFIFSELWRSIASEQSWEIAPALMLWYLALTEVVVMSVPRISLSIEQDLRADRVTNLLLRPLGYFRQKFAEFCGQTLVRFGFFLPIGVVAAAAYTGEFPLTMHSALSIPIALALGTLMALIQVFIIGMMAVWIGESTPISWLYQKLQFVLGGLMIPLHFYPDWLANLSFVSPFASMIYGPASLVFDQEEGAIFKLFLQQLLWIAFSFGLLVLLRRAAIRRLVQGEGSFL